jgi:hypothetical protein
MKAKTIYVDDITTTSGGVVYYTVPNNTRAKLVFLHIENNEGSGNMDIEVYVNNGTDHHILHAKAVSVGADVVFDVSQTSYIMLEAGYSIKAESTAAGGQLILTVEETQNLVVTQ